MERVLNNIFEDSQQILLKVDDLYGGLFGDEDVDNGNMDGGLFGIIFIIVVGKQWVLLDDRFVVNKCRSMDLVI